MFFALVWCVGFFACFARTIRDADFRDAWHCFALSCCSGLLCFAVVSIADGLGSGSVLSPPGWLGVSSLLGLLAKEQDKIGRAVLYRALAAAKAAFLTAESLTSKDQSESDENR